MGIPFQLGFEGNKRNVSDSGNMRIFLDEPSSASCLPKVFSLVPPPLSCTRVNPVFSNISHFSIPLSLFPRKVNTHSPGAEVCAWVSAQE